MNCGSIDKETAAGRLYRYLRSRPGVWVDAAQLAHATKTIATSTRVSEVRHQLKARDNGEMIWHEQRGNEHFYRIVVGVPGEQLDLAI